MNKFFRHSEKCTTQQIGSISANHLPIGRGWMRLFMLALLLLAGSRYAYSQNSASQPYLNSWHRYSVTMGVAGHQTTWHLERDGDRSTTQKNPLLDTDSWVNITRAGGIESIDIYFTDAEFDLTTNSHWYLVYSEWEGTPITGLCTARREFEITVTDNLFYLTLPDDDNTCNSRSGDVLNGDDVVGVSRIKLDSYVEFTVTMNKAADHLADSWGFKGVITMAPAGSYDIADVTFVATGTSVIEAEDFTVTKTANGEFEFNLVCSPSNATYTTDEVVIRVNILGFVTETINVTLTLSDGKAYSGDGSTFIVETDDNILKGGGASSRDQTREVLPLPAIAKIIILY